MSGESSMNTAPLSAAARAIRDADLDTPDVPEDSVIYTRPGRPSPIEHVIYIIKENRTYDQVFGKIGKGNGDPSLTLFDESAAPNHYKLAREFVLFDNFYVNADVSADGHNWSTAAIAPDFVQKLWPSNYGRRLKYYGFEGSEPANLPPAGYLWTNALAAGLTVRNYGEWLDRRQDRRSRARKDHEQELQRFRHRLSRCRARAKCFWTICASLKRATPCPG